MKGQSKVHSPESKVLSLEDHPFSVACKCARFLHYDLPALCAARAERALAEFSNTQTPKHPKTPDSGLRTVDYSRPWNRRRLIGADEKASVMLSRFNGHPIRLKEFEHGVADRAVFQRILRAGHIEKVGRGLYRRKIQTPNLKHPTS